MPMLYTKSYSIQRQKFGRVRRERWGPRTLDLDLLLFDQLILDAPTLQIPHPRMVERAFVLIPLAENCPRMDSSHS
jgi:2-amino-4-hydroxy-6-hydroxymethyldihydropteridine diphosphokinase